MPFAGRSSRGTGTSTPPRPTATRRVSGSGCARAECHARRSSSRRSSSPTRMTRSRSSRRACAARPGLRRPLHRPLAGRAARPGRGRGWSERVSRICAVDRGLQLRRRRPAAAARDRDGPAGRGSGAVQSVRVPQGAARLVPRRTGSRSRPTARLEPAATSPATRSRGSRSATGALPPRCCCAGASSAASRSSRSRPTASASPRTPQIFDFRLSDEDIAELDALDRTGGTDRALERKWWRS